jgi:hypothetical protein
MKTLALIVGGRYNMVRTTPRVIFHVSLGISVVDTRILGCERANARSHPKIRPLSRQILKNLFHYHGMLVEMSCKTYNR